MKVYISTDLEGVGGVCRWEQTREYGTPANIEARHLLMGEVNAAVEGAFEGGATQVVVDDGHGGSNSFFVEDIDERAEVIMGKWQDIDVVPEGFDAGFLLGFHAMSNTKQAVLAHTQSSRTVENCWINGRLAGEIAQSAITLGARNVPVVMVTGDDKTCAEAVDWLGPNVVTVQVKKGLSIEGAQMLAPKRARALIREGARTALSKVGQVPPYRPPFPLTIRWQYKDKSILEQYKGDGQVFDPFTVERVVNTPAEILKP